MKLREEHKTIINQWNKKVERLTKKLNDVVRQRDQIKNDLEKKLNEKILEYKLIKS